MAGNAFEWVNDWYSGTYYGSSPSTDPPGPASGTYRVLRGGSWTSGTNILRSSNRNDVYSPGGPDGFNGFRVARAP
jgi:formylglycine-generating enzyme required for sulfatase activity